jgi:glycosyltransferase involved in cell wall biosynthesis
MKIIYFYQYFTTPEGSYGTRVYEFTKEWVAKGHDVTVVTSLYSKSDLRADKFIENQVFDGVKVKVLNIKIDNKQSFFKRIFSFINYSIVSSWYALILPSDVVIASSGPITVAIPALISKYIRRKKLIFEVRDLWPEVAIELGVIKNKIVIKFAYWLEKKCYEASSLIVALSPGMKSDIANRFGKKNIISITNSANIELFSKKYKFNNHGKELNPLKYAIYTGNIGEVNNSYWLFNTAKILTEMGREDIKIVLVGDGQQKQEIEKKAKIANLHNIVFLGLMSKKDLIPLIQNAIASLVPLKDTKVLNTSSPNKFFESLAAGVPVIQNTQGWMKVFLEEHNVGFTLDPNCPDKLAEILINLIDNDSNYVNMRSKASEIARIHFDKKILASKMLDAIILS